MHYSVICQKAIKFFLICFWQLDSELLVEPVNYVSAILGMGGRVGEKDSRHHHQKAYKMTATLSAQKD